MSRGVNVLLALKDQFSEPMKKAANTSKEATRAMKSANNSLANFGRGMNDRFNSLAGTFQHIAGTILTLGGVLTTAGLAEYGRECAAAAQEQLVAETKLEAVLKNVTSLQAIGPNAYKEATQNLVKMAGEYQKVGIIGDEITINGMQQLATFQLSEKSIKTLTGGMLDMAAQQKGVNVNMEDMFTYANMIGKAMTGQATALSRVGVTMTDEQKALIKMGTEEERAATIAEVLAQNFGGVNEALAKTDVGKIKQAKNAYSDMQEEIGFKLIPLQAKLASVFSKILPDIQKVALTIMDKLGGAFDNITPTIEKFAGKLPDMLDKLSEIVSNVFTVLGNAFSFLINNSNVLLPLIAGIVTAFESFKAVSTIMTVVNGFIDLKNKVTIAGGAMKFLSASFATFPAAWIALAIAGIVAAFVYLWNNCETFRNGIMNIFNSLKALAAGITDFFSGVVESIAGALSPLIEAISTQWEALGPKFAIIGEALMSVWDNYISPFLSFMGGIFVSNIGVAIGAAITIFSGIIGAVAGIMGGLMEVLNGVIEFIAVIFSGQWSEVWGAIADIFLGIWHIITGAFDGFISGVSGAIQGLVNSVSSIHLPSLGGGGGGETGEHNAAGTAYWKGGLTHANEAGGEIMNLPRGTQIIPHDLSLKALSASKPNITISLTVAGNVIGNEDFMNQCGEFVSERIMGALANT